MNEWVITAEKLRDARNATRMFLDFWMLEARPAKAGDAAAPSKKQGKSRRQDGDRHDWSMLYQGSVLDD